MNRWMRFRHEGAVRFGTVSDDQITLFEGDMFSEPQITSTVLAVGAVEVMTPVEPTKIIGLWNNLRAAAQKQGRSEPGEPLYFFKPPSCVLASGGAIVQPHSYAGRVIYEGELGVVIGKTCKNVPAAEADDCIFGYTCANDVTAVQMLHEDESFAQWCRSKSFDTFGAFGPVVATGLRAAALRIQTRLNGRLRQDYPASDLIFSPQDLVERLSRDMTLYPGDLILCGTSTGALPMKAGSTVDVTIDGIGTLTNTFERPSCTAAGA